MAKNLTRKQQIFVAEYLKDSNATRSAIAAGYSEKTANQQGPRLLVNVGVAAAIAEKTGKRLQKLEITADRVLQEIAKLAFLDPRKFFDADGNLKRIVDLDDDSAAAIAGVDVLDQFEGHGKDREKIGEIKKIKLADKGMNLERLGRHLKLFDGTGGEKKGNNQLAELAEALKESARMMEAKEKGE